MKEQIYSSVMEYDIKSIAKVVANKTEEECIEALNEYWKDQIFISWCKDDILKQAKQNNVELTDKEIISVLQLMINNHDATVGVNWDVIDCCIHEIISERNESNDKKSS